jgi:hypothetical protein
LGRRRESGRAGGRARFEERLTLSRDVADRTGIAYAVSDLSFILIVTGELSKARTVIEEGLAAANETGVPGTRSNLLERLADIAVTEGDATTARLHLTESVLSAKSAGSATPWMAADRLQGFARIAAVAGQARRALRLEGAMRRIRETTGWHYPRALEDWHAGFLDLARRQLSADEQARAETEGRAMTPDQAIAYALTADDG